MQPKGLLIDTDKFRIISPLPAAQAMSLGVCVHALGLLNVCDYATRVDKGGHPQFVGCFLGEIVRHEIVIYHAFELKFDHAKKQLDHEYFERKLELYRTNYPTQHCVGWYSVGYAELEPWMVEVQRILSTRIKHPVLGLFTIPFTAEISRIPLRVYELNADGQWCELSVAIKADDAEQIALNDILSSKHSSNGAMFAQLAKQTKAFLLLHQNIAVLKKYVESAQSDETAADPVILGQIVSLAQQADRVYAESGTGSTKSDEEVISELLLGLMLRGDYIISNISAEFT